jgi:glyoxylate reductase
LILEGIGVSNAPHTNQQAVADQAIFLMVGALRRVYPNMIALREGKWRAPKLEFSHDPEGKVLGIIGMGAIGQEIAKRALAFDMKVIYHNRHAVDKAIEQSLHTREVDMDELLATSDVISLSLAYTPETYHIIDAAAFSKMKKGVTIVNTARGKMIDEEALIAAMDDGTVWSAGLDVFEEEPAIHSKLLADPRVILTPHMAAGTIETYLKMEGLAMKNVETALMEGRLVTQVHEQSH